MLIVRWLVLHDDVYDAGHAHDGTDPTFLNITSYSTPNVQIKNYAISNALIYDTQNALESVHIFVPTKAREMSSKRLFWAGRFLTAVGLMLAWKMSARAQQGNGREKNPSLHWPLGKTLSGHFPAYS